MRCFLPYKSRALSKYRLSRTASCLRDAIYEANGFLGLKNVKLAKLEGEGREGESDDQRMSERNDRVADQRESHV